MYADVKRGPEDEVEVSLLLGTKRSRLPAAVGPHVCRQIY